MLTITTATPDDVAELAQRLTPEDAAELRAAGMTVAEAMAGTEAQALRWHGELVCLFGAVLHQAQSKSAIPWMLCTTTVANVPRRQMAGISAKVVDCWRDRFDHLANLVHRHNSRALRFVRWLGFRVGDVPCGPGQQFLIFEWSRHV
ncbi:MAG: hypothetical protein ACRC2X_12520 [Giesbergeria sp.]